ncbi:MAG: hypothetical protein JST12_15535 [Armatimonadetes bacterium]|nr:hypothetical protein [Armatimonadota bacterium]MBS1703077.1 hypothetical protein [Armatimonadota bacterium]
MAGGIELVDPEALKRKLEEIISQSKDQDPERTARRQQTVGRIMESFETMKEQIANAMSEQQKAVDRWPTKREAILEQGKVNQEASEALISGLRVHNDLLEEIVAKTKQKG